MTYKTETFCTTYTIKIDAEILHTINLYEEPGEYGGNADKTLREKLIDLSLYNIDYDGLHLPELVFTMDAIYDTEVWHDEIIGTLEDHIEEVKTWLNNNSSIHV